MMDENTRFCSACGARMLVRLGQYECPGCGRTEPLQVAAAGPARPSQAAAPSSYDPGAQYRTPSAPQDAGPPPPPGSGYGGYGPAGPGYGRPPVGGDDPLKTEKYIYLGLQALAYVLLIAGLSLAGAMMNKLGTSGAAAQLPPGVTPAMMGGLVAGSVIGCIIAFGLLVFVLFSREIWAKWTCMGCQGCGVLISLAGLFAGTASKYGNHPVVTVLQLCVTAWFLSILYRDIQNVQQGS